LGFHPSALILPMSSSMFLTSPFQPLPPSTSPVSLSLTFLRLLFFTLLSKAFIFVCVSSYLKEAAKSGFGFSDS
jgi:hypothetical protein